MYADASSRTGCWERRVGEAGGCVSLQRTQRPAKGHRELQGAPGSSRSCPPGWQRRSELTGRKNAPSGFPLGPVRGKAGRWRYPKGQGRVLPTLALKLGVLPEPATSL